MRFLYLMRRWLSYIRGSNDSTVLQIWVYRTVLFLYFSVNSDRKVPKEHRQRAGRPLDTRLVYMGLSDREDTWARFEKHLRSAGGDTFLSAPKLTPRWARLIPHVKSWFLPRGRGSVLPLVLGKAAAAPVPAGKKPRQTPWRNNPLSHRVGEPTARPSL